MPAINCKLPPRFLSSFQLLQIKEEHRPKLMFLSAVARPRDGFNGIVGFWRVAEDYEAQRDSAYHDEARYTRKTKR